MKTIVRINTDNSMNDLNINIENKNIVNLLNKTSNNKGNNNNIRQLYTWNNNNNIIKLYGWYEGEHGKINKHELIPNGASKFLEEDSSTILLYGDIFLLCYGENNRIKDYTVSDYAVFTEIINEGFDDCDSDEYSEEDNDEVNSEGSTDEDYVSGEDESIEHDYEIISTSDSEELNYDNNNY